MKFSDFPIEIKNKVQERCLEQGYEYSEKMFNSNISIGNRTDKIGLVWDDTPEEHSFWYEVLEKENFDTFFQKYPKQEGYKEIPKDVKVGDSFKLVSYLGPDGTKSSVTERQYNSYSLKLGDVVVLYSNDGSTCPRFTIPNGKQTAIYWAGLVPVKEETGIPEQDCQFKVGDVVQVIGSVCSKSSTDWPGAREAMGKTMVLTEKDIKSFLGKGIMCPENNEYSTNFTPNMLRVINHETTLNNSNLNSNKDGFIEKGSGHPIELLTVIASVTYGSVGRGTAVSCPGITLTMGS